MNNRENMLAMVRELTGQNYVVTVPRVLIRLTNDIKAAVFLSQCIYWSDKTKRTDGYFYKTAAEWKEELGLSRDEIDRILIVLKPYIQTKVEMANGAPTRHYHVDMDAVLDGLLSICGKPTKPIAENPQNDLPETLNSLTEITTQITTPKEPAQAKPVPETSSPVSPAHLPPQNQVRLYAWHPTYGGTTPTEDEGDEESDPWDKKNRRKWETPTTDFQVDFLAVCRRKFWRKGEKSRAIAIEKGMQAASMAAAVGQLKYPTPAYVEKMFKWAREKNKLKAAITVPALLNAIESEDNWNDWLAHQKTPALQQHKEGTNGEPYDYSTSQLASNARRLQPSQLPGELDGMASDLDEPDPAG